MGDPVDLHEDLVDVPLVAGAVSAPAQPGGLVRPELGAPGSDRLVGEHDTAGQHQLLDVAQAQRKTVIQKHRVPDDLDRIPVTLVRCRNCHNDQSWRHHHQTNNLTIPSPRSPVVLAAGPTMLLRFCAGGDAELIEIVEQIRRQ